MTVSNLTSHFPFTRYAVLKHLRVLEDAGLIVRRRNGKTKELYINAIPIQAVYDRWISHYSALWASRLTALKYKLEKEEPMTTETKLNPYHCGETLGRHRQSQRREVGRFCSTASSRFWRPVRRYRPISFTR